MNPVFHNILGPNEADILLNFLDQLGHIIHKGDIVVKNFIENNAPFHTAGPLVEFFADDLINRDSQNLRAKILQLEEELNQLPITSLTISFEPDTQLSEWLLEFSEKILGKKVLFEVKTDSTIGGGAVVEGNGRIGTYTLREYFEIKSNGV